MARFKVKAKVMVTKETEITADNHDAVKKIIEADFIKEGYTDAKIDYIKTEKLADLSEDEELDFDVDFIDYQP